MPLNATPTLIHVPHAATEIPADARGQFTGSDAALRQEVLRSTDWFTDELFASGARQVRFPVSRLVVDPERFEDDAAEPMAARGRGVLYACDVEGRPIRRELSPAERERLLAQYYRPHHAALTRRVADALAAAGGVLVIDAHSFPAEPWRVEPDQRRDRPDFCIGTDPFHTPPALRDAAVEFLRSRGFSVAVDRPYAGALVPLRYYRKDPRVRAIMIEVNRRLYLDEATGCPLERFASIRDGVVALCRRWEGFWE